MRTSNLLRLGIRYYSDEDNPSWSPEDPNRQFSSLTIFVSDNPLDVPGRQLASDGITNSGISFYVSTIDKVMGSKDLEPFLSFLSEGVFSFFFFFSLDFGDFWDLTDDSTKFSQILELLISCS